MWLLIFKAKSKASDVNPPIPFYNLAAKIQKHDGAMVFILGLLRN